MQEERIFNSSSAPEADFSAATTDIITSNAHGLVNEDVIQLSTTDTLPAGLSASTNYYVRDVTTNTFKVSTVMGGPVVDVTDTGTGTHTYTLKGKVILTEGYEHLQLSVNTDNSANLTMKVRGSDQEDAPDFMAAQSPTNRWDCLDLVDLQNKASIDGDTGLSPAGTDDNRLFEVNVNGKRWITVAITAFTAGTLEVRLKKLKKYN